MIDSPIESIEKLQNYLEQIQDNIIHEPKDVIPKEVIRHLLFFVIFNLRQIRVQMDENNEN
jgi:hypothetical protein